MAYRRRMTKKASRRDFRKKSKVHKKNYRTTRGGVRL